MKTLSFLFYLQNYPKQKEKSMLKPHYKLSGLATGCIIIQSSFQADRNRGLQLHGLLLQIRLSWLQMNRPEILIKNSAEEILTLVERLNKEFKKTIIIVTHDPHAAERAHIKHHLDKGELTLEKS